MGVVVFWLGLRCSDTGCVMKTDKGDLAVAQNEHRDRAPSDSGTPLPCPHCGNAVEIVEIAPHKHVTPFARFMPDHPGSFYIECCGGMIHESRDELIKAWNTRAAVSRT